VARLRIIARNASWLLVTLLAAACGGGTDRAPAPERATPEPTARAAADARPVILFVGTSLTAGYGLDPDEAYPARIQEKIERAGLAYRVVNAGVSGETSAGARRRIDWLMESQPVAVLVVETGANDGLRGIDPEDARANIQAIFDRARQQSPPPALMLVGMAAPPNLGARYTDRFRAIYPELARRNGAVLVPFLLEGVAGQARLNQPDGIHPTAEGQRRLADNVWKPLRPMLRGGVTSAGG
jgi:acyl-CoA thioesterase-1